MSELTYDVVLLIEQPLSRQDAVQVRGLHDEVEEHRLPVAAFPVEDREDLLGDDPGQGVGA